MWQAILLKEWLKLRWTLAALLVVHLGLLAYLGLALRYQFQVEHSEMIWYWAFELRRLLHTPLQYLPAVTGAALALAQFGPERLHGRFRLSLHLPVRADLLVWSWLAVGALLGAALSALDAIGLYGLIGLWFPREAAASAVLTALPWLLAGWVAYCGATLALLEPAWPRRLAYLGVSLAFVGLLFQERGYQEYDLVMPALLLLALLYVPAVILPAHRYRHQASL
ncbi:hypothetical protein [Rhabdochromatium marinum]|uniref:hypothetical protein n=1 Tax=Rhabdochromatium marinum TaxID=48729 RepID=UPI001903BCD8|nr:hypothetical protein [Rhabdochromatium marinum]MBK1647190.1 hypothetical protein [Rhabdochromatium marinum]